MMNKEEKGGQQRRKRPQNETVSFGIMVGRFLLFIVAVVAILGRISPRSTA